MKKYRIVISPEVKNPILKRFIREVSTDNETMAKDIIRLGKKVPTGYSITSTTEIIKEGSGIVNGKRG